MRLIHPTASGPSPLAGPPPAPSPVRAAAAVGAVLDAPVGTPHAVPVVVSGRRRRAGDEPRGAVLYPLVAEAAHRVGAASVGLVDVGCSAGLDLALDRVGIRYDDGRSLGDPSSPVQLSAAVVGGRGVPGRAVPPVVARVGIDTDPLDLTHEPDARWLRASVPPDQPERSATLDAAIALTVATRPTLLRGDVVDLLPEALALVPPDALPVVTTTWALSKLPPERRLRFLQRLDEAATGRPVAWVSAEGVGVAPAVPTLGDRHASGHSILGVTVLRAGSLHAEAVGRCWSRGRMLAWLGDDEG